MEDIDESMKYLDTDGDGEISFNEFLTWCAASQNTMIQARTDSTPANMILLVILGE